MEMDDEEDVVIEEIPVFLSKNLQDNLYLFQYPNKTNNSNFDSATIVNCCFKPVNEEAKVDFALNVDSRFYDRFKGEQFAIAADGKTHSKNERPTFRSGIMDKQSYTSAKSLDNVNKYVVGIFQDREIHFSPLKNILQLTPNFSYFDKQDKRAKTEQEDIGEKAREEEARQVKVKFSNADSDRIKKLREKSYEYIVKRSTEEPWCETLWHPKASPTSELEKQKLFASTNEQISHTLGLTSEQYIEKLVPNERSDQSLEAILPTKIISKAKLKTLPLKEQLQTILKDARMLSFNKVMAVLEECDKDITAEKVLRMLPLVGVLIRGNWVAQSEILYPPNTISNVNGVPSELMIRGRDYILYKFSKQEYLNRRKVIIAAQLPHDEVSEILHSVARLNAEKKWELLLPPDTNFEARYQELVQRQDKVWRAGEQMFNEMDYVKSPKRVRKRSVREVKIEKP